MKMNAQIEELKKISIRFRLFAERTEKRECVICATPLNKIDDYTFEPACMCYNKQLKISIG